MHKLSNKIRIVLFLIICLNLTTVILCGKSIIYYINRYIPITYNLGIIDRYGYAGVRIRYDKEPVYVEMISPDSKRYSKTNCTVYENDQENKTITLMIDTTETGLWKVKLNRKSNKNITYTFLTQVSSILHVENAKIIDIDGSPYLTFIPIMTTKDVTECQYSIQLHSRDRTFALDTGHVALNKKAYILIDPPQQAFTGETYDVILSLMSLTDKPTHLSETFSIFLSKYQKPQKEKENPDKPEEATK